MQMDKVWLCAEDGAHSHFAAFPEGNEVTAYRFREMSSSLPIGACEMVGGGGVVPYAV